MKGEFMIEKVYDVVLYKPGRFANFLNPKKTQTFGEEVIQTANMLLSVDKSLKIGILSRNNVSRNSNIFDVSKKDIILTNKLVVFSGYFDIETENDIMERVKSNERILISTDFNCFKKHNTRLYDKVVCHFDPSNVKHKNAVFFPNSLLRCKFIMDNFYKKTNYLKTYKNRKRKVVFIGSDVEKLEKFKEYVLRPNVDFYGKSKMFYIHKPLSIKGTFLKLKEYRYTIIFHNPLYEHIRLTSSRLIEASLSGCIPIIDYTYKPYNNDASEYEDCYVNSYENMVKFIRLTRDINFYKSILERHERLLYKSFSDIENKVYKLIFT